MSDNQEAIRAAAEKLAANHMAGGSDVDLQITEAAIRLVREKQAASDPKKAQADYERDLGRMTHTEFENEKRKKYGIF